MTDKVTLLLEAERRGILPPEKAALLAEAKRRGLVGAPRPRQQAQPQQEEPGYWSQRMGELKALGQGARFNVAETALGVGQLVGAADEQDVATFRNLREQAQQEAAASSPRGEGFFGGGEVVGGAAQIGAPMLRLSKAGKLGAFLQSTGAGAAYGATRPVTEGDSRSKNTGLGALFGAGGHVVGAGLAAAGQVASRRARDVFQAAEDRGIPLTFAQLSESEFIKRIAHLSDKLPFSGATQRQATQTQAVNRELAKEIGSVTEEGGKIVPKVNEDGVIDAGIMGERYARFGDEFDRVFSGGMQIDRGFLATLADVRRQASEGMDDAAQRTVETVINRLRTQARDGQLNGRALQSLDRFLRNMDKGGDDRQQVAHELREALHDTFSRVAPAGAREFWDKLRREYSAYKRLEPVVARNPDGPIAPTQLTGALNADKMGRARQARGESGNLGALAGIGRQMRGPQTSGTPEGAQTAAVGYGLMANPVSTLGLLLTGNTVGRALNSNILARLMMQEGRGRIAPFAPYARPVPLMLSGSAYADEPEGP